MTGILSKDWVLWAIALVVSFPLLAVVLGEAFYRLERRRRPLAAVARGLRNLVLPIAVLFVLATRVLGFEGEAIPVRLIETALWIAVLFVVLTALNVMLFEQAGADSWRGRVPKLFLDLVRLFLVFVGGALVLSIVWNRNLGGLLAALGVGSIVLGLALQDTLGSLMSGIALLFERPFKIGDWIKVGGSEGEVIQVNWRSVHLRTRDRDLLVVPNSVLAKETITNTCEPSSLHAERIAIAFSLDTAPNRVRDVLVDVARSIDDVLADPAPKVEVMAFEDDRVRYDAKLYMTNLRAIPRIRSEFTTRAWYAAQRAGLDLPVPALSLRQPGAAAASEDARFIDRALGSLASIAVLETRDREALAAVARLRRYADGEAALEQEAMSEALYVVVEGRAQMTLRAKDGGEREIAALDPGDLFGEGALLTGEPSRITVTADGDLAVVALDTATLKTVLERNAALASELGQLVEVRRRTAQRARQSLRAVTEPMPAAALQPRSERNAP